MIEATARRELPFGLGRQPLARPLAVGHGVIEADVDDGMILLAGEVGLGAERMTPVGTGGVTPPLERILEGDRGLGRGEHDGTRDEHLRVGAGVLFGGGLAFGDGDVAGGPDELIELGVGDLGQVHPEAGDADAVGGLGVREPGEQSGTDRVAGVRGGVLLDGGIGGRTAHQELAARYPDHARGGGDGRWVRGERRRWGRGWCSGQGGVAGAGYPVRSRLVASGEDDRQGSAEETSQRDPVVRDSVELRSVGRLVGTLAPPAEL